MSNNFTSHFSADDAALLLIDFQPQMFMGVESHDRNAIKNNLQIIAKSAKLFNVPTVLSTDACGDAMRSVPTLRQLQP
jgi:nicotinamidase-related amidase